MTTVSYQDWRQDPDALLQRVADGESLVVLRDGKPVVELRPVNAASSAARPYGLCKGEFVTPESFSDPLSEEVVRGFEAG